MNIASEQRFVRLPALVLCAVLLFALLAQAAAAKPEDVEALLNAAPLSPVYSNDADVDRMVAQVLEEQTTPQMTTAQKVKALYDYCIAAYTYAKPDYYHSWLYYDAYKSRTDAWTVCCAAYILQYHVGVCDHYSAAYTLMLRAIGLEAYHVRGTVVGDDHMWTVVRLNGSLYSFDPEVDYKNKTKRGSHVYLFYGMPESVSPKYYGNGKRQACIDDYGGFARTDGSRTEPTPQVPPTRVTEIRASVPVVSVGCAARLLVWCTGGSPADGAYEITVFDAADGTTLRGAADSPLLWTPAAVGTHQLKITAVGADGSSDEKEIAVAVCEKDRLNGKCGAYGAVAVPAGSTPATLRQSVFAGQDVIFSDADGGEPSPDAPADRLNVRLRAENGAVTDAAFLVLRGDADGSGKVNAADARRTVRTAARLDELDGPRLKAAADMNGDGRISASDAREILRAAARIVSADYLRLA